MQEQIRSEIRKVIREIESSHKEELIRLRTFHYNIHHIVYDPIRDKTASEMIFEIKELLEKYGWS